MLINKDDINRAGILTVQWVREQRFPLLALFVIGFAADQYFGEMARELMHSEQGPLLAQLGNFLTSLTISVSLYLMGGFFLVNRQTPMTAGQYLAKYTSPLTAESLRALTRVLLWTLVFILPGVVMYARMMFLPFVIFFDREYATHPDAVRLTLDLTRRHWLQILLLIIGLNIFEAVFELIPNLLHLDNIVLQACIALCGFVFSLFSFILLYMIFEHLMKRREKGS